MATPGELVKAMATVLGVPEAQVVQHDRNLAIAGLRTVGGRGRSAAKMTAGDAANLLIGVAASSMVKETVEVVRDYAGLPNSHRQVRREALDKVSEWPGLRELPDHHNLHDAICGLIEAASTNALFGEVQDVWRRKLPDHNFEKIPGLKAIEITFFGPFPQARINIGYGSDKYEEHHYSAMPTEMEELQEWAKTAPPDPGDLVQIRIVTEKTLFALGDLLKS